ncbi:sin3-associated polypeptide Sap18 [Diplocarpon mali]|nr:sin3-associated polypeptide Sap18 [Diplocarpon mali]
MESSPSKINRQTNTPFLLKLFYRNGGFHSPSEFSLNSELPPHVQIYTWPSCTLRELSHLLTSALPSLLPEPAIGPGSAPGPGRYMSKDLGSVIIGEGGPGILPDEEEAAIVKGGQMAGALGGEPDKTLQDARFVIGDYVLLRLGLREATLAVEEVTLVPEVQVWDLGRMGSAVDIEEEVAPEGVVGILTKGLFLLGNGEEESKYLRARSEAEGEVGVTVGVTVGDMEEVEGGDIRDEQRNAKNNWNLRLEDVGVFFWA